MEGRSVLRRFLIQRAFEKWASDFFGRFPVDSPIFYLTFYLTKRQNNLNETIIIERYH